jgi:hypothetical protein
MPEKNSYRILSQDEFDAWLISINERIQYLRGLMSDGSADLLDYSLESLDHLEQWLLKRYSDVGEINTAEAHRVLDAAGTYVGETLRFYLGGVWKIELADDEDAYWGIPHIRGFRSSKPLMLPHPLTWATTSISRRTGHFVRDRLQAYL